MKSFSLIRTNPKLTTNVKVVVNSNYDLYLESYDSVPELSADRFKKMRFNKKNFYDELVPHFFRDVAPNIAFSVKYSDDSDKMFDDYEQQYDDIYLSGCANIEDTEYDEEFECNAPLHIDRFNLPSSFVIFRVDGPGIIDLNKENFREEILDKLKCVTTFDLSDKTPIGEFLDRNYRDNDSFPDAPFELDVRSTEFSKWNGIEYESGGYSSKSLFLEDWLSKEKTFFDFEKFITDGYENNKVVYPNIINMKFLFDDTPADTSSLKKWSINRYFGFYMNSMDNIKTVSFYTPFELESDLVITNNNICVDSNGNNFKPIVKDWNNNITYFLEYRGDFFRITRYEDNGSLVYKIISDYDLSNKQSEFNKNIISIDSNNVITYNSDYNTNTFEIEGFDKADVWLVKIDTKFHVLRKVNGNYIVQSDYGFRVNNNKLEYFINESDSSFTTEVNLANVTDIEEPQKVEIYRLNFTDIKDFDTSIVNTDWSKYEYEIEDVISDTDEPKLYKTNLSDSGNPKQFDEFIYNNELYNIPTTSEYVASSEIFETIERDTVLSDIWRKNSVFTKWAFKGSIANSDYPYKANNSLLGDDFNRVVNPFEIIPNRLERNLDYFYTLNPDSNEYLSHSLHVTNYTDDYSAINPTFSFDIENYLNVGTISVGTMSSATYSSDYFEWFFGKKEAFKEGTILKNSNKYSTFNYGDNVIPNSTLFKGIKFNMYEVSNLLFKQDGHIDKISIEPTNEFNDYKFSIILTENDKKVTNGGIIDSNNSLEWTVVENWELDKQYSAGDIVVYHDIIWVANVDSLIENSNDNPFVSSDWSTWSSTPSGEQTALWSMVPVNPPVNYYVYRYGEYYYYNPGMAPQINSFWIPTTNYNSGDKTIYKNVVYESVQTNISKVPLLKNGNVNSQYWKVVTDSDANRNWHIVEQWNSTLSYGVDDYALFNNKLYQRINLSLNSDNPEISNDWEVKHSIEPDTDKIYGTTRAENNIIRLNGEYYLCTSNPNSDTLDNGIDIYINKKWKNVLINIYNNDNTLPNLKNTNRDDIYNSLFTNLTAKNFMDAINDMDNKYGFTDYIRYIVIDEDNSYNVYTYDDNLTDLPYLIEAQAPDELQIRTNSFNVEAVGPNDNLYKVHKKLKDNEIEDITFLNYYNNQKLGARFTETKDDINIVENASGLKNINFIPIYRFSGDYMPIFRDIELFKRPGLNNEDLSGNYKFDTSLNDFGLMKERVYSKVNLTDNLLKLRNLDNFNSIYPMIDEFGYSFRDHFIFKSTWDLKYYISTEKNF